MAKVDDVVYTAAATGDRSEENYCNVCVKRLGKTVGYQPRLILIYFKHGCLSLNLSEKVDKNS